MTAGIYTKGFSDVALFWRLRRLINMYTRREFDSFDVNLAPPAADTSCVMLEDSFGHAELNSQYQVLMANDLTGADTRKPVKRPKLSQRRKLSWSALSLR